MNSFIFHEPKQHGTPDFPVEYYYLDKSHPRYNMPMHWHKEWEIIHIIKGTFTAHADDQVYIAHSGDILLMRDGMLHGGTPDDCVYECFLFDLHGLFRNLDMVKPHLRPVYRQQILPDIIYPAGKIPEMNHLLSQLSRAYQRSLAEGTTTVDGTPDGPLRGNSAAEGPLRGNGTAEGSLAVSSLSLPLELIVIGTISQLFATILQEGLYTSNQSIAGESTHKIGLIKTVLEYIELHYASSVTLNDLAAAANMNPRYFCRFFRSITHQSPMEYVNMYRIEKAAQMLLRTRLPVTNVCMECGFNECSNFIKVFRKYKGVTPNQYRKG